MFAYCGNNPVMYIDPCGTSEISCQALAIIAVVGATFRTAIEHITNGPPESGSDEDIRTIIGLPTEQYRCYNYSIQETDEARKPGYLANEEIMSRDEITLVNVTYLFLRDMEASHRSVRLLSNYDCKINSNESIIAVRVIKKCDFHFMLYKDGKWTAKDGTAYLYEYDIVDPASFYWDYVMNDELEYDSPVVYFAVENKG